MFSKRSFVRVRVSPLKTLEEKNDETEGAETTIWALTLGLIYSSKSNTVIHELIKYYPLIQKDAFISRFTRPDLNLFTHFHI